MSFNKVATPSIVGSELLTNGMFSVDASGWTLGSGWAYSNGTVLHTAGNTANLTQGPLTLALVVKSFRLVFTITGTAGTVSVKLTSGGKTQTINAGVGQITLTLLFPGSVTDRILYFTPTTDFNGAISTVGLRLINQLDTKVAIGAD